MLLLWWDLQVIVNNGANVNDDEWTVQDGDKTRTKVLRLYDRLPRANRERSAAASSLFEASRTL